MKVDYDNQSVGSKTSLYTSHRSETSFTGHTPSSASSSNDDIERQHQQPQHYLQAEEKTVFRAKVCLYTVLFLTLLLAFFGVYGLSRKQEVDSMKNLFEGHSSEITSVTTQKVDKVLDALDAFAFSITSQAMETKRYTNTSWPFYRVPQWSKSAAKLAETSGFKDATILFAPVVNGHNNNELKDWETYFKEEAPIWYQDDESIIINEEHQDFNNDGLHLPIWQQYPLHQNQHLPSESSYLRVGYDLLSDEQTHNTFEVVGELGTSVIHYMERDGNSYFMQPIYDNDKAGDDSTLVGVLLLGATKWADYLENLVPVGAGTIDVVIKTLCQQGAINTMAETLSEFTYQLNGPSVVELGNGDLHETDEFDDLAVVHTLIDIPSSLLNDYDPILSERQCIPKVTMHIYATKDFQRKSKHFLTAEIKGACALSIFLIPTILFLLYDFLVGRRQRKFMDRIIEQDLIVSNVFPTAFRDRLYDRDHNGEMNGANRAYLRRMSGDTLAASSKRDDIQTSPMADLFPNTTVVFADIAGFTAWASAREPQQVFMLLESIYVKIDKIAYRHGVFKVETVGDCYVAVAGLPEPCDDHAVVACKFARDCLKKMNVLTRKLEVSLGPDTADLDLRVGIHSGQVTAGVLRGDRCRFQLFGDTVNTAARMESSGERNKVQISKATADLLKDAGHGKWVVPRSNTIYIKGKGDMQTYWLQITKSKTNAPISKRRMSSEMSVLDETAETEGEQSLLLDPSSSAEEEYESETEVLDFSDRDQTLDKTERLVEWNVAVLSSLLCQIIASRISVNDEKLNNRGVSSSSSSSLLTTLESSIGKQGTVLEEFVPIIPLKRFNEGELKQRRNASTIDIGDEVRSQLRKFLTNIASMYNQDNPFHNFEHASHVTASVTKLLKRIVNVDEGNGLSNSFHGPNLSLDLVDLAGHSYGITSDPLTQFAVVFSAIVHDVDHPGVPNTQLLKEKTRSAQIYQKSIAEQNSVELSWDMLMAEEFTALRACIYTTEEELKRFRQLVVNTVMATDVVDKELQALRKSRWDKAFSTEGIDDEEEEEDDEESEDRKATIVIEHLIQASDVSHTMQHWHIYKQWNQKFFMECYGAYRAGRADVDPSIGWYKGEIGFFDFYVIPLAKKLDNCGVFGVASDEYLNYAVANREEWARDGEKLVESFKEAYYEAQLGDDNNTDQETNKNQ